MRVPRLFRAEGPRFPSPRRSAAEPWVWASNETESPEGARLCGSLDINSNETVIAALMDLTWTGAH